MGGDGIGGGQALDEQGNTAFVEVLFARTPDEAADCRHLLEARGIPARVESGTQDGRHGDIAVLVAADRLVDASELLTSQDQAEDSDEDCEMGKDDADNLEEDDDEDDDDNDDDDDGFDDDDDDDDDRDFEAYSGDA